MVAGACTAVTLLLQPAEKRTHHVGIENRVVKLIDGASDLLCSVEEEEFEGVAVGQHCMATGSAFDRQVCLEEILDECLERGKGRLGGLHEQTSSSARVWCAKRLAACSRSGPLATRYSRVFSMERWPRYVLKTGSRLSTSRPCAYHATTWLTANVCRKSCGRGQGLGIPDARHASWIAVHTVG